jgi:hypothetical protein
MAAVSTGMGADRCAAVVVATNASIATVFQHLFIIEWAAPVKGDI